MEALLAPIIFISFQEAAAFAFNTKLFTQVEDGLFILAGKAQLLKETLSASYSFHAHCFPLNKKGGCLKFSIMEANKYQQPHNINRNRHSVSF